jgi:hypothetical protein
VKGKTVADVVDLSGKYLCAGAIDLLLRRVNIDPQGAIVAAKSIEPRWGGAVIDWLVAAGGQVFVVLCHKNGSALLSPADSKHLATVTADEIKAHVDRAAAGRIKAPE